MHLLVIIALSALAIQLLFLGAFLYAFQRRQQVEALNRLPGVSVIVAVHDEEENLRELLPLLMEQDHPDYEVIVVEDRCNDGTYDFLLDALKQYPLLKMVRVAFKPEHIHGKKYALTLGIKAARHEWVLLTDADCRPVSKGWIRSMIGQVDSSVKIILGFSPYLRQPGWLNAFIRFESFLTGIQFGALAMLGKPYMGVGRNLAYRKSLFLGAKGFHGHLEVTGGDDDLFVNRHAHRLNTRVAFGADALVMSKPKTSWGSFYIQKIRHLSVGKRYRISDQIILGAFSLSWILTDILMVPALLAGELRYALLSLFLLRWIFLGVLFHLAPRRMGEAFEAWKVPILDFIYGFYYLVAGLVALVSKKVRWKR